MRNFLKTPHRRRCLQGTVALLVLALVFWLLGGVRIPELDNRADAYFESAVKQATVAYATTRVLNGAVSTVKDSEVQINPGGLGISYAAGQVLDPVDDMTERVSNMLVLAIASLGVQKLVMELGIVVSFKVVSVALLLLVPALWLGQRARRYTSVMMRLAVLFALLRFLLPVSALINDAVYEHFLQSEIEQSRATLAVISMDEISSFDRFDAMPPMEEEGVLAWVQQKWDSLKERWHYLGDSAREVRKLLMRVLDNLEAIMGALVSLMGAYLAVFVLQVLLIPLGMLYGMLKFVDALFSTQTVHIVQKKITPEGDAKLNA